MQPTAATGEAPDLEAAIHTVEEIPFTPYSFSDRYMRTVGKHIPACGGRCMVPDSEFGANMHWVSFTLIFIPTMCWFIFEAPDYWSGGTAAMVFLIAITFITSNTFL